MIPPERPTIIKVEREAKDGRIRLALVAAKPDKPRVPPGYEAARELAERLLALVGGGRVT